MPVHQGAAVWTAHLYPLFQWNVLSSISQDSCHPYQFAQELPGAANVCLIEQLSLLIEDLFHDAKVDIPEYGNESQFPQNRLKVLDHACTSENSGGNTNDAGSFVNVFLQTAI